MKDNMLRVLVTGLGGDIGQGIAKCLRDRPDVRIIGCDIDRDAGGAEFVDVFIPAPYASEKQYVAFIDGCIRKFGIASIFPASDPEIAFFDANRAEYDAKGVRVAINEHSILELFADKYLTAIFLEKHGIAHPRSYLLLKYSSGLRFPVVIKPRCSAGGRGMAIVSNKKLLSAYRKLIPQAVVQEYVGSDNEEFTTGVFSAAGTVNSITFRRKLGFNGVSQWVELINDKGFDRIAAKIASACGLNGMLNIQSRKHKGKIVVFEINPRFSSTVFFRHFFGFQDVLWWLDMGSGRTVHYKALYKAGIGIRVLEERFTKLVRNETKR